MAPGNHDNTFMVHVLLEYLQRYGPAVSLGNVGVSETAVDEARVLCEKLDWQLEVRE